MKRFFVFLFMLLATFSLASAQTIDIKGTVIDENGEPVIGASVMIKGTLKGDITAVSALAESKRQTNWPCPASE